MPDCADVHAFTDGKSMCVTAWRPTPEELVKLNLGEPVFLCVLMTGGMPPVSLSVGKWWGEGR